MAVNETANSRQGSRNPAYREQGEKEEQECVIVVQQILAVCVCVILPSHGEAEIQNAGVQSGLLEAEARKAARANGPEEDVREFGHNVNKCRTQACGGTDLGQRQRSERRNGQCVRTLRR